MYLFFASGGQRRWIEMSITAAGGGKMPMYPRWVRIHNREERLFRASKRICPKMRPHSIRRRQHPLKISHLPNFPSWRRHAIVWILLKFSIISQIQPHYKRYFCISSDGSYDNFGGGNSSDSKTWHESKLDIIFVDKIANSTYPSDFAAHQGV